MREREIRRPMPVDQAISWKPLRDSHYVVASLQPGDGGRRKIFVRQHVLSRVESLVRAHGRRACGLLLGQEYQCSETGANYMVIESIAEQRPVEESELLSRIGDALARHRTPPSFRFGQGEHRHHVLGWYRGVPRIDAKPSALTASVHTAIFDQPWHTLLVMTEPGRGPGGAFFLNDTANHQWFCAPFYELPDHLAKPPQPKPTVLIWPEYMTVDNVALTAREPKLVTSLADASAAPPTESLSPGPLAVVNGNGARRLPPLSVVDTTVVQAAPETPTPPPPPNPSSALSEPLTPNTTHRAPTADMKPIGGGDSSVADRPVARPVHDELGTTKARETGLSRRAGRAIEKLSVVDDRDQRAVPRSARRVRDDEDTTSSDDPARFLEIAQADGFFIAASYDAATAIGHAETLWVLNDPFSGMLLVVVTAGSEVVDATLHYNLQTDDAGLQRVPFPEHRDAGSKTIYVRETCVDGLRARCQRLRATNALLREWRVTPTILLLTPTEWESVSAFGLANSPNALRDLNTARIAGLPEGLRTQFHLTVPSEDHA